MLMYPRPGQRVVIHYAKRKLPMPHHGLQGTVKIPGRDLPRNHLIQLDNGSLVIVPAGHINKVDLTNPREPQDGNAL